MSIELIPALQDNYQTLIVCDKTREAAIVDPADANSVMNKIAELNIKLTKIINTHHHWDHVGGNLELRDHYKIPVVCSHYDRDRVPGASESVGEGDEIRVGSSIGLRVIDIPGHTLGHIALCGDDFIVCGDTLFGAGCGRLFEGTPAQMHCALQRIAGFPSKTRVFCGHEYTLNNLLFAQKMEPHNAVLNQRLEVVRGLRKSKQPTVPSLLEEELQTNPFLRLQSAEILQALLGLGYTNLDSELAVFTALREYKNQF